MVKKKQYQRKWHNHIEGMPPEPLPLQAYFYHPTERRVIERPRLRWTQQFY
jgi:hypothetical protein